MKNLLAGIWLLFVIPATAQQFNYPLAPKGEVRDTFFGEVVADPYRWMEIEHDPKLKQWLEQEKEITKEYFKNTTNDAQLYYDLKNRVISSHGSLFKSGRYFFRYFKVGTELNSSILFSSNLIDLSRESLSSPDRVKPYVLIRPTYFSKGDLINYSNLALSEDGRFIAFAVHRNGQESSEIRVWDINKKEPVEDILYQTQSTNIEWSKYGFFYCRFDSVSDKNNRFSVALLPTVYYHQLGTLQSNDQLIFRRRSEFPPTLNIQLFRNKLFITEKRAATNTTKYYWISTEDQHQIHPLPIDETADIELLDATDSTIITITNFNAPNNRIVEIPLHTPTNWTEIVPEQFAYKILQAIYKNNQLLLLYQGDTQQVFKTIDLKSQNSWGISLTPNYSYTIQVWDEHTETLILKGSSFCAPPVLWISTADNRKLRPFERTYLDFDIDKYAVRYTKYFSKDSTPIPIWVVYKKGTRLNGTAPGILSVTAGFNYYQQPWFDPTMLPFLDRGGVYACANIRGGDYIIPHWHEQGIRMNRQHAIDDVYRAALFLKQQQFIAPDRLGVSGSFNGSMLTAACINQYPDVFRAAILEVGLFDLLRFHQFTNGNLWRSEFGNPEIESEWQALYRHTPLHHIATHGKYPAMLIITAENDDRVTPFSSYKYVAALQASLKSQHPILLHVEPKAGHFGPLIYNSFLNAESEFFAFLFRELGMK